MKNSNQFSSPVLFPLAIILGVAIASVVVSVSFMAGRRGEDKRPVQQHEASPAGSSIVETQLPEQYVPVSEGLFLTVSSPENNSTITKSSLVVQGKTSPNAEVFVNDKTATANGQGDFSAPITLEEGENIITVSANDVDGNYASSDIMVTYEGEN